MTALLDPTTATLADLVDPAPDPGPADWNDEGVVVSERLIPDDLIDAYRAAWSRHNGLRGYKTAVEVLAGNDGDGGWVAGSAHPQGLMVVDAIRPGGWPDACPYMRTPELLDISLYPPLMDLLAETVGSPMGLHLNLTGWESTRRSWHQDTYLNPLTTGDNYAAVWIALDDVHPDSGVFQFVPGSHRWHRLMKEKVARYLDTNDPGWPTHSEAMLTELVAAEIAARNAEVYDYTPQRGDVLLWHPRLYHQGSVPLVDHAYRPALIAHYTSIYHRPDAAGTPLAQHPGGGHYWEHDTYQPVRPE